MIEIPGKWHFKGNFYGYLTVESARDPGLLGLPDPYYLFQPGLSDNTASISSITPHGNIWDYKATNEFYSK